MLTSPWSGGIIPAYAGSTCSETVWSCLLPDHPRLRGEHAWSESIWRSLSGSSPPTRGARLQLGRGEELRRIIPAYAGSTSAAPLCCVTSADHPRLRGEHKGRSVNRFDVKGSSPPTRGARVDDGQGEDDLRIIPAYAGSTRSQRDRCRSTADHPRLRGEHASLPLHRVGELGSSPPTRGARRGRSVRGRHHGIIPAYAGSTASSCSCQVRKPDHPRLRGEHFRITRPTGVICGSSPPTRGALHCPASPVRATGIIPAYAGSTGSRRTPRPSPRDHPRLRGEHLSAAAGAFTGSGSSPPTRGARSNARLLGVVVRIIPAYAGST